MFLLQFLYDSHFRLFLLNKLFKKNFMSVQIFFLNYVSSNTYYFSLDHLEKMSFLHKENYKIAKQSASESEIAFSVSSDHELISKNSSKISENASTFTEEGYSQGKTKNQKILNKLKKYVDYLVSKNFQDIKNIESIVSDKKCSRYLKKINTILLNNVDCVQDLFALIEYPKVMELLTSLFMSSISCTPISIVDFFGRAQNKHLKLHNDHNLEVCVKISFLFLDLSECIVIMSEMSKVFRKFFHERGATQCMIKYLSNKSFLDDCGIIQKFDQNYPMRILINIVIIMYNLTRTVSFKKTDTVPVMLFYSQVFRSEEHLILSYMILTKCLNENKLNELPSNKDVLKTLVKMLKQFGSSLRNMKSTRTIVELELENYFLKKYPVSVVVYHNFNFNLIEIINALYAFNMSDQTKRELFLDKELVENLKQIVILGNEIEVEYATKLLFQFAHDDSISQSFLRDKEFNDLIQNISNKGYENSNLKKYCQSIIWLMNKKSIQNCVKYNHETIQDRTYKIVISSDIHSRKFCLDLKYLLQNEGKNVYFRDESLIGYDLEEILAEIIQSDQVIICKFQTDNDA